MNWLHRIAGLFVEDPILAAGAAGWIVLIALLGLAGPGLALARALALALGLCAVLAVSIVRDPETR